MRQHVIDGITLFFHPDEQEAADIDIDETREGFLAGLLTAHRSHQELEDEVADAVQIPRERFWTQIDAAVVDHFKSTGG